LSGTTPFHLLAKAKPAYIYSFDPPMKISYRIVFATLALLGIAEAAHAQLYIATGSTGVTTQFNFNINTALHQVTLQVNNTQAGVGGVTGTLTSFGFHIPATLAGTGSLLSTTGVPAGSWSFFEPYNLSSGGGGFAQNVGAGTGNNPNGGQPNQGVQFGNSATFLFQFANFTTAAGFLGLNGVTARWQGITPGAVSNEGFGVLNPPGGPGLTPVPEPSTYGLFGVVALLVGVMVQRKRRQQTAPRPTLACAGV
jgi:hypothetical protein